MVVMETEKPTATMAWGRPSRQRRLWGSKQAPHACGWGRHAEDRPDSLVRRVSSLQGRGLPPEFRTPDEVN